MYHNQRLTKKMNSTLNVNDHPNFEVDHKFQIAGIKCIPFGEILFYKRIDNIFCWNFELMFLKIKLRSPDFNDCSKISIGSKSKTKMLFSKTIHSLTIGRE